MKSWKPISLFIIHSLAIMTFALIYQTKGLKTEIKHKEIKSVKVELDMSKKDHIDLHNDYIQMRTEKAMELANKYVGKKGDCYRTSIAFIKELKGITDYELVQVDVHNVETGDLIFYRNNGHGLTHYAVVLDYDNNIALQPNWNGRAIIGQILYDTFSKPIYYRLERQSNE